VKYALFTVGSSIEYFSIFILMFTLFRFRLTDRLVVTLLVSVMMSQVSYFTRLVPEIGSLSSFIQLGIMIIVLWVLFRVPIFYSLIMNAAGFICGAATQGIVIFLVTFSGVEMSTIQDNPWISTAVQLLSVTVVIAIARTIFTYNLSFDYVPVSHRARVKIKGTNAILMAVILTSLFITIMAASLLKGNYEEYVFVASATFLVAIPLFLYYSRRKDDEDAS